MPGQAELNALWTRHNNEWRDAVQVVSQWREAAEADSKLLRYEVKGRWEEILSECKITLLATREYEHLALALGQGQSAPLISYLRLPHPSGLAVDRKRGVVHIVSTRNPNQIYDFMPVTGSMNRLDMKLDRRKERVLVPVKIHFYPGAFYMHDLAYIGDVLYGNAVGQNAVVRLSEGGSCSPEWWPRCIERGARPDFGKNYIQLNSIASGKNLESSFFSASTDRLSVRRPGHKNFKVDKQGVIFSGRTREPVVRGLTRPHSARLYDNRLWVDNSGYGEFGFVKDGKFVPLAKLPGWTRGLCFYKNFAFVGTSRVIPRFRHYATGLELDETRCGIHIVDIKSGKVLGGLLWPYGNQIFALDWVPGNFTSGFPFKAGAKRNKEHGKKLFYSFKTELSEPGRGVRRLN